VREENPSGSGDGAIRVADGRFFAPSPVERVQLLGSLDDWRTALSKVGIQVVDNEADLVVCEPRHVREAAGLGAPSVLVLGSSRRPLRRAGYVATTLLVRPGSAGPRLYVPVEHHSAVRVALLARAPGRSAVKRLATVAVVTALRAGVPLPGALTFASRSEARPRLLTATLGAEFDGAWYLLTGEGDDLQRLVWFCFDGSDEPTHVVKFSRVAGNEAAFDREAHSLRALEALPPALRRHAPGIAGRESVDGLPVTVETAVPGRPLHVELAAGRDCTDVVAAIADWIVDLGEATRVDATALAPEIERLEGDVLPPWAGAGAPSGLARRLPAVPAVLQHNDIGCWNVHVDGREFAVVDWESSRMAGLPLWDLLYFLTDALAQQAAHSDGLGKEQAVPPLLRGELALSQVLFERLTHAAERLDIPAAAVGPIATLSWLEHARSPDLRAEIAALQDAESGAGRFPLEEVASYWLSDPLLGVDWPAYSSASRRTASRASSPR
jgi:hypothetical protein